MMARPLSPAVSCADDRVRRRRFVRLTVANFFFFLTFASFFLLPLHIRALGGSERAIGFAMGTTGLSGLASVFVVGILLDRFGRIVFLRGGLAAMALASLAFLAVDRVGPALFVLRGVQGLAFAAGFNAASTLAAEFAPPERRAAALGLFGVSTLITHAIAPALGELIVSQAGFHALFVVAAAYSALGLAIAWGLPAPPMGDAVAVASRLRATRVLRTTIATVACCGISFGTVITYVPTFVHDAALGPVATFFLSYTAAAVLIRLTAGGLGDVLGRPAVIQPALGLLAISLILLARVGSTPALAAAAVLFGAAQGLVYPTLNAYAIDQAEAGQLGRAQTLYNGAFNLGVTGGSMILGPVVEALGYRVTFMFAAAVALVGLACFRLGLPVSARAG
jgi:MFS family permease